MPIPNRMANWQSRLKEDDILHQRAVALSKARRQSLSELVRTAIEEYLDLEEPRQKKLDVVRRERRNRVLKKIGNGPIDEFEAREA